MFGILGGSGGIVLTMEIGNQMGYSYERGDAETNGGGINRLV
jgi:hypothetical protein